MFFPATMTTTLSFIMESQHILSPWASGTGSTPISLALYRTPTPLKREKRTVWGAPGKHDERSQRVSVRLKKGAPLCICVGLVQITFFHVTIKARVYLCFSWRPSTFITEQTVVFGVRVQTESRTWFKKGNTLKSEKHNFRVTGIWLRSRVLSPFLKGKQLFGKYERLNDRYPPKGQLLNSVAYIVLGFTGFEWMFSSVLSTNVTVLSNDKTQLGVAQKKHVMVINGGPRMLEVGKNGRKLESSCCLLQKDSMKTENRLTLKSVLKVFVGDLVASSGGNTDRKTWSSVLK